MCLSTPLRVAKSSPALLLPSPPSTPFHEPPRDESLPSRDEAIQMILSSRWWDPSLGAPLPLASLLSHNATQERGWLKYLLFPATGNEEYISKFDETLTLAYLSIVFEIEGLASNFAEAWDETEETAKVHTKYTVEKFAYHPILKAFPHEYHESIEPIAYLFSLFPSSCLGSIEKESGKLALIFLDAALFRRGRCHSNSVKRLFPDCDGAKIGKIRSSIVGTLFQEFDNFENLSIKSPIPSKQSVIQASREAVTSRIPLAAVNQQSAQSKALGKNRRLKRQNSTSLRSRQVASKKTKTTRRPDQDFWGHATTSSQENTSPAMLR